MEDNVPTSRPSTTITNTSIVIVSSLLNKERWMMVWEMEKCQVDGIKSKGLTSGGKYGKLIMVWR